MSFSKGILAGIILSVFLLPIWGNCAQSTADVSASKELKESALKEILSEKAKGGTGNDYVIGIGDILDVSIFGEGNMAPTPSSSTPAAVSGSGSAADNTAHVEVRMDGQISLKHIGDVRAEGLTLTQLADYLKKLYKQIFDDPVVTTVLVRSNSSKYSLMGKVMKPGIYPLTVEMSLVEAIAAGGGFNEWSNREVTVIRKDVRDTDKNEFKNNTLEFDYNDFLKGKNVQNNISVQSGDVLVVH